MEMALALVLLAGAGLMIRTLAELWRINPGFDANNVALLGVGLPPGMAHATPDAIRSSLRQAEQAIAGTPGIQAASLSWGSTPMRGDDEDEFWLEGQPKPASVNDMNWSLLYVVQPGYFQVMKVPLLRGRLLTAQDNEHAAPVALIDENLARRYFPHTDPLGQHMHFNSLGQTVEIVGVVGHVKQFGLDTDARSLQEQTYLAMMQTPDDQLAGSTQADVLVRTTLPALTAEDAIRRSLQQVNRDYVIFGGESMNDVIGKGLAARRFSVILLAGVCRPGAAAGGHRNLRRRLLRGGAAPARDRHPHGPGRAPRPGIPAHAPPGRPHGANRAGDRSGGGFWPHPPYDQHALRGKTDRRADFRRSRLRPVRHRPGRLLHTSAPCHKGGPHAGLALRVARRYAIESDGKHGRRRARKASRRGIP